MNVLHTSDWHLGKRLMDRERLSEQEEALSELVLICERENVDLVLVAGDVFDTYLPPTEAEELFFRAVKELAGDKRAVVIISGNHDDGVRLSASAPLAKEQGVYIFGNRPAHLKTGGTRPVRAVEAGENYLVIENAAGEKVFINALPYPNEARLKEDKSEESFPEKMKRWIARGDEHFRGDMPHILLSHLFVAGGKTSESERDIDLGGARAVPVSCLPEEGYVALGHLHRNQAVGKNIAYSGSLLAYSFDEANTQKSVNLLEIHGKDINFRAVPLSAGRRLVRLECRGVDEALRLLPQYADCYIELTLHITAPLTFAETQALRGSSEGLVSLVVRVSEGEKAEIVKRSEMNAGELFTEYYKSLYGENPPAALKEEFLKLLGEGGE